MELSNEIVDLVDLVLLICTFSKDINPGYEALACSPKTVFQESCGSSAKLRRSCQRFSVDVMPKLEHQESDLRTFQA